MGNSVIYRPAYDAEVEYLESDGNSYIDTGLKASSELGILAHIYVTGIFPFGGRNGFNNKEFSFCAMDNVDSGFRFGSSIAIAQGRRLNELYEFDNTQNHNILKVGNTSYVATYNSFISDYNVFLFGLNNAGVTVNSSSRIYDFKIYQNSTLVRDFIPVRIGSTGYMYDKVSKQLFANKGTGNFILGNDVVNAVIPQQRCVLYFGNQRSVGFERIYEEFEWLVGDGSAYIDTNITEVNQNTITLNAIIDVSIYNQALFGAEDTTVNPQKRVFVRYSVNKLIVYDNNPSRQVATDAIVNLVFSDDGNVYLNDDEVTTYSSPLSLTDSVLLFAAFLRNSQGTSIQNSTNMKVSHFSISNQIDLTPVKLLQSIPAILDGNGIARQAGECGMWDKVSNKFYGNVANSGTFTVKGPKCYEEYKWLVAEIPPQSVLMTIGVGDVFNYSRVYESIGNSSHLLTDGYNYYTSSTAMVSIGVWNGSQNVENKAVNFTNGLDVVCTQDKLTFNSVEFSKYAFPASLRWNNSARAGGANTVVKTSSITVDGSVRYVPCKLTHGIPASMDANGIARPAGTCGMWDKVNDVFYGNVASSGTFTVSND